jgi:hypothetical protein
MERSSRKKFSSSFKSKVALEAVKGLKTINEIASGYDTSVIVGQYNNRFAVQIRTKKPLTRSVKIIAVY